MFRGLFPILCSRRKVRRLVVHIIFGCALYVFYLSIFYILFLLCDPLLKFVFNFLICKNLFISSVNSRAKSSSCLSEISAIDIIATKVSDLCQKERNTDTLKRIHKQLKESEAATKNLVKALESRKAADIIAAQIEKRQSERTDLDAQLTQEKVMSPDLTFEQVKFFFEKYKHGDENDLACRRALVDTFVSKIWLFNDKLVILCNAGENNKIDAGFNIAFRLLPCSLI